MTRRTGEALQQNSSISFRSEPTVFEDTRVGEKADTEAVFVLDLLNRTDRAVVCSPEAARL